jgi:hypothetical protein
VNPDSPQPRPEPTDPLRDLARLSEAPVTSDVPLLGGLIVAIRQALYSISARWYVRPLLGQQTAFNEAAVATLDGLRSSVGDCRAGLDALQEDLDRRLIALDRDHVHLTHDLGEATVALTQINRALEALEARLDAIEAQAPTAPPAA